MDYFLLNALAISAMAVFGIWVFQYGAKKQKEAERKKLEQDGKIYK